MYRSKNYPFSPNHRNNLYILCYNNLAIQCNRQHYPFSPNHVNNLYILCCITFLLYRSKHYPFIPDHVNNVYILCYNNLAIQCTEANIILLALTMWKICIYCVITTLLHRSKYYPFSPNHVNNLYILCYNNLARHVQRQTLSF